nr:HAD-IA family hydrolase [Iamia sp. SCSIO 61187]
MRAVRAARLAIAVVSSSAKTVDAHAAAGITDLFGVRIDGVVARERKLPGKPAPDRFLAAAAALGVAPTEAAVFEGALAGVEAGTAVRFGFVVGVDRNEPGRRAARPGRRRRRARPGRAHGGTVTGEAIFEVEPWRVRESSLALGHLPHSESVFALSNGHIGCEATSTRASRTPCPART